MYTSEALTAMMAASQFGSDVQTHQTRFRKRLVDGWNIAPGARILEIGCGQGDMTVVLADAVGESGHVTAVDLGPSHYGAPVTLGESLQHLQAGPLGDRIRYHLEFDVLDDANPITRTFTDDQFDAVVLSHCTWYFASLDSLRETFTRVRPWTRRLLLSEWDLQPETPEQMAHLLSVLIQGQIEAYKTTSEANVRTPYAREVLRAMLGESGWGIASERLVDSSELEDARWEIEACLQNSLMEAETLALPPKLRMFLQSQVAVLRRLSEQGGNRPLPSYSLTATRF